MSSLAFHPSIESAPLEGNGRNLGSFSLEKKGILDLNLVKFRPGFETLNGFN